MGVWYIGSKAFGILAVRGLADCESGVVAARLAPSGRMAEWLNGTIRGEPVANRKSEWQTARMAVL